jgi:murein L,D-transpeptidase YafK
MNHDIHALVDLARRSRKASEISIPIHIFPFHMTEENLKIARQKGPKKWVSFWENLKQGYDEFENSHLIPKSWYNPTQNKYSFTQNRNRSLEFKEKHSSILPEGSPEICTSTAETTTKTNIQPLHNEIQRIYNALDPTLSIDEHRSTPKAEDLIGSIE